jgi:cysteinyl-tRNA synthetase
MAAALGFGAAPACRDGAAESAASADAGADSDAGVALETAPVVADDAGPEVGPEAVPEAGHEAGSEAGPEAVPEAGREAGSEPGPEAGPEAGREAGTEVGRDTGAEAVRDAGTATDGRDRYRGLPQPMCVWNEAYQENYAADTVPEILAGARNCYVLVDPFASTDARAAIAQMQQLGNTVGCYISVGTCEDWRDDYAAMKPYCVSKQWGDWPGEYFVDRTDPALVALMEARIDKMAAWGCDLVEFDNMDFAFDPAYRSQYGITATAAEGEAYNQTLCAHVHGQGMGCMAKSSAQGAADFDGLTVESSQADMDWWTPADMEGMLSSGKIGIVVHYDETDCASVLAHYQSEYGSKLSFICEDRALKKYRHFP